MVFTPSAQLHFCATCGLSFEQRGAWEVLNTKQDVLSSPYSSLQSYMLYTGPACVLEFPLELPRELHALYSGPPRSGPPYSLPPLHHDVHLPLKDGRSLPGISRLKQVEVVT